MLTLFRERYEVLAVLGAGGEARVVKALDRQHDRIVALAKLGAEEQDFKEDVAHLLYDEARVLDGDKPVDAKAFSTRLARLISRGLPPG